MGLLPSQWCEPTDSQRCLSTLPGLPRGSPAPGTVSGERLWGRRAPASLGWHELSACCCRPWPLLSGCLAGKGALWEIRHLGRPGPRASWAWRETLRLWGHTWHLECQVDFIPLQCPQDCMRHGSPEGSQGLGASPEVTRCQWFPGANTWPEPLSCL